MCVEEPLVDDGGAERGEGTQQPPGAVRVAARDAAAFQATEPSRPGSVRSASRVPGRLEHGEVEERVPYRASRPSRTRCPRPGPSTDSGVPGVGVAVDEHVRQPARLELAESRRRTVQQPR